MERSVLKSGINQVYSVAVSGNVRGSLLLAAMLSACAVNPPGAEDSAVAGRIPVERPLPAGVSAAPPDEESEEPLADYYPDQTPVEYDSLWSRIAAGFRLQQHYGRPEVQDQVRSFSGRRDYFELVGERARPFLLTIVKQIEERGLPMEIALIPFVESGFNPYASSPRAAMGPWQILAATGRGLGLRVDEWFDGRRDPIQATAAALDYLVVHNERFDGDWLLTFAAYNSGGATVSRALRGNSADPENAEFWELPLPGETRLHVPRILALASILQDHEKLDFALPEIDDDEELQRVRIGGSASIVLAAELAGLEPETVRMLNPGFRQWWTPPTGGPDYLNLPDGNAESLRLALRQSPDAVQAGAIRYRIQPGDTLSGIARDMSVPVAFLRARNEITGDLIVAGEYLWIPGLEPGGLDQLAVAEIDTYRVRPRDTLGGIAVRFGKTLEDILLWNSLTADEPIHPGQLIKLAPPTERLQ